MRRFDFAFSTHERPYFLLCGAVNDYSVDNIHHNKCRIAAQQWIIPSDSYLVTTAGSTRACENSSWVIWVQLPGWKFSAGQDVHRCVDRLWPLLASPSRLLLLHLLPCGNHQWWYGCSCSIEQFLCVSKTASKANNISLISTLDGTRTLSTSSSPSSGWPWPTPPSTPSSTSRWTPSGICLRKLLPFINLSWSGFVIIWRQFQHPSLDTFHASTDHPRFSFL